VPVIDPAELEQLLLEYGHVELVLQPPADVLVDIVVHVNALDDVVALVEVHVYGLVGLADVVVLVTMLVDVEALVEGNAEDAKQAVCHSVNASQAQHGDDARVVVQSQATSRLVVDIQFVQANDRNKLAPIDGGDL